MSGAEAPRLLGAREVRELAAAAGIRPTKARGQNFVIDPNTVRRIAELARLRPEDVVLEVGPGLGSLTLALIGQASEVIAVEIDHALAEALPSTVARCAPESAARLQVIEADAMELGAAPLQSSPTMVVANLPYNVAVPVLLTALQSLPSLRGGLVMVQQEVADRLCAGPGTRTYGVPSVKLAWYADAEPAGSVPPSVFWPAPRVDSGLVRFTRHHRRAGRDEAVEEVVRAEAFAAIDAAFSQRRKVLRTTLAPWAGGRQQAETLLRAADIDPGARGETLGADDFRRLADRKLAAQNP